ncbi:MAG: hypothetical protein EHM39_12610, partial [Chloroflexi bacterium]
KAAVRIAGAIVREPSPYHRTVAAAREALAILREGIADGRWQPGPKEMQWLDRIQAVLDQLPESESRLIEGMQETYGGVYHAASYGL